MFFVLLSTKITLLLTKFLSLDNEFGDELSIKSISVLREQNTAIRVAREGSYKPSLGGEKSGGGERKRAAVLGPAENPRFHPHFNLFTPSLTSLPASPLAAAAPTHIYFHKLKITK